MLRNSAKPPDSVDQAEVAAARFENAPSWTRRPLPACCAAAAAGGAAVAARLEAADSSIARRAGGLSHAASDLWRSASGIRESIALHESRGCGRADRTEEQREGEGEGSKG